MINKSRLFILIFQGLVSLFIFIMLTLSTIYIIDPINRITLNSVSFSHLFFNYILPAMIHVLIAFGGSLLLFLSYGGKSGVEAQLIPLILINSTIYEVRILKILYLSGGNNWINASLAYYISQTAVIITVGLFFVSVLFTNGENKFNYKRTIMYTFIASFLFISIIPHSNINNSPISQLTNNLSYNLLVTISIISALTLFFSYFYERNTGNIYRTLSIVLLCIGNFLIFSTLIGYVTYIGLLLYLSGLILLGYTTKSYHIWN